MERKEIRKEIRKVGKKTGKFLENLRKMYNQMEVFQKIGVWVWMAGEGMTRGVHRAFAGIPTHHHRSSVPIATILMLLIPSLTSCKTHKQSTSTDYQHHQYTISSLKADSIYTSIVNHIGMTEDITLSIYEGEDEKPTKKVILHRDISVRDSTDAKNAHLESLQSKIDSSSYNYTTEVKKVKHTQNLIRWQDWCFAIILAALILLIYVKKR